MVWLLVPGTRAAPVTVPNDDPPRSRFRSDVWMVSGSTGLLKVRSRVVSGADTHSGAGAADTTEILGTVRSSSWPIRRAVRREGVRRTRNREGGYNMERPQSQMEGEFAMGGTAGQRKMDDNRPPGLPQRWCRRFFSSPSQTHSTAPEPRSVPSRRLPTAAGF